MNKLFTKIAAFALGSSMAIGVGVAVAGNGDAIKADAAATSYTITFNGSASESTTISTSTTASSITESSSYVTGNVAAATKAYGATSSGVKLGTSSAAGSIKINLSASGQVTPTSVVVNAKLYNSSKSATLGFNGSTKQSVSSSYSNITFNHTTAITYIQIDVTKYVWVKSVTVNYNSGSSDYVGSLSASPNTWSGYDTDTLTVSNFTISGSKNGTAGAVTSSDYEYKGIGYMSSGNFVARDANFSSGHPTTADTRLAWKAKYPTTAGGSTYAWAYVTLTVTADSVSSVALSSNMSTTSYTTADSWSSTGLVVTATYASSAVSTVTTSSTFAYYSNAAMTEEVATPNDLGVGNNQTIYVKATFSGISNTTGYSQTVSVTKAPSVQSATINLTDITLNDAHSQDATDVSITKGAVTFAWTKVSGSVAANSYIGGYNSRSQTRIYTGHHLTVTADSNVIKSIDFTGVTGTSNGPNKMSSWTNGTLSTYDTSAGTATVTADTNATSLECTPSANTYLTQAVVYYYAADVPATGITINGQSSSTVSITPYQTTRLVASVLPLTATDRTFSWSLNPNTEDDGNQIITIDANGNVEPIEGKYGDTVVTATSTDGGFTATCTVTVERVSYHQAVYSPTSTSSVSTSGTLPEGETHTFSCGNYQTGYAQLTTNNPTATLTLSGYDGQKIRAILLKMHSNVSAGSGSLSVVAGETIVASISTAAFSDESWNGEYTTDWVLIEPDFTEYDVQNGEDIVVTVTASVNSLFLSEVRVQYEASEIDNTAVSFAELILDGITCNASGTSAPDPDDWAVLVSFWNDGTTITAAGKAILLEQVAVEHDNPSTDSEKLEAAMAKYDYIIGKYNKAKGLTTEYPDFIGRNPSPIGNSRIILDTVFVNNNAASLLVVIAMLGLTVYGGYFFLHKKKED